MRTQCTIYEGRNVCIPGELSGSDELPQSKGYIRTSYIDSYENGCFHVRRLSDTYTDGYGKSFSFYFKPNQSLVDLGYITEWGWAYNCVWYAMRQSGPGPGNWLPPTTTVCIYKGGGSWLYTHDGVVPPPWLPTADALKSALISDGWTPKGNGISGCKVYKNQSLILQSTAVTEEEAQDAWRAFCNKNSDMAKATESAFFSTCSLLRPNINNAANIAAMASLASKLLHYQRTIKSLVKKTTSQLAADVWLKYRYAYQTTVSDIEELGRAIAQYQGDNGGTLRTSFPLSGGGIGHLKIRYSPYENPMLNTLMKGISGIQAAGLDPSLYNLWDMIPFSFIIDWFVPVGTNLEKLSQMKYAATMPYTTAGLVSYSGTSEVGGRKYHCYDRSAYSPTCEFTWYSDDDASQLTWAKRALDVTALTR